jgi:hypothetical protein
MKFWNRLRLAGNVIVLAIALLAILASFLAPAPSTRQDHKPAPSTANPSESLRPPGGTSGL